MNIPVTYNDLKVGEATNFNKDTGEITVTLDMDKECSKEIMAKILGDVSFSMSCNNVPASARANT